MLGSGYEILMRISYKPTISHPTPQPPQIIKIVSVTILQFKHSEISI